MDHGICSPHAPNALRLQYLNGLSTPIDRLLMYFAGARRFRCSYHAAWCRHHQQEAHYSHIPFGFPAKMDDVAC